MRKIGFAAIALICLASCENPNLHAPYGNTYVYMPQANRNLGADNNFFVSISSAQAKADPEHHSSTILGVYRSGLASLESFDVSLCVDPDTLARAFAHAGEPSPRPEFAIYASGILLDSKYYSFSSDVLHVPDNSREATTHLVFNDAMLVADYPVGKNLFLPVRLLEPSKYSLNESLSMTMVVVQIEE